jgi:hypothetical protein
VSGHAKPASSEVADTAKLLAAIHGEFPVRDADLTDEYIEQNPDPTRVKLSDDWFVVLPAYMSWCVRSPRRNQLLVLDHTIAALADFGRYTQAQPAELNFRSRCNREQIAIIVAFLRWCQSGALIVHDEQVARSLRRWERG